MFWDARRQILITVYECLTTELDEQVLKQYSKLTLQKLSIQKTNKMELKKNLIWKIYV